jgi:hypothetical protein
MKELSMNDLEVLLEEVEQIKQKHDALNQREARGFNVFSLLLKAGDEVNLHTKFIYELLNPKGSHHQGELFLDLFLKELKLEDISSDLDVFREKHNIDILLQSSTHAILIENKIYTQDHSSQLSRYVKTMKNQGYKKKNIRLIYLTLFGHTPTEKKMQKSVLIMSYRKNIVNWLLACIAETEEIPILRETLKQYLNLVRALTHQSKEKGFMLDVKKFLLEENNLQKVIALEESIVEAKIELQLEFWHMLLGKLIPHYAFSFYNLNKDSSLKNSVRRYYELQKNTKDYGIKYQVDKNVYFFVELRKNVYYGFEFIDEHLLEVEKIKALESLDIDWNGISDGIYWKYPNKNLDFKSFNHQNIFDLLNSQLREKDIGKISNEIINLITQYERNSLCLVK